MLCLIILAEFSKLGSVTAVSCRVINVKCIGDATCYLTPPTLAWAGHRSPDIFYIFAELTLAALTFVGTGTAIKTAINIVVNADTTTMSKREEDWL